MNDTKFEELINLYRESYKNQPLSTLEEMSKRLKKLNTLDQYKNKSIFYGVDMKIFKTTILIILIILVGLLNVNYYAWYIGGFIFYIAGILIGLHEKWFGLIFLFSHGMTGFGVMIGSLIGNYIMSPAITDCGNGLYIYLGLLILLTISAVVLSIMHNISDIMKKKKRYVNIIFSIFLIIFLLAGLLPYFKGILF